MLYSLDSRCQEILQFLLHAKDYIRIQDVAREQNISKRSVYYDLCKINDWLEAHHVSALVIERNKGISIGEEQYKAIMDLLNNLPQNTYYLFSPMERVKVIICTILMYKNPIYIEDFIDICNVSRNTVISDLKVVSTKLQEANLKLSYETKKGYFIKGDVIRKRSVFFLMFTDIADLYRKKIVKLQDWEKAQEIEHKLKCIEKELNAEYVRGVLFSIAVFFSTENRNEELVFSIRDKMEISHTDEFKLVSRYFTDIQEGELYYLSLHLLGSRLQTVPMDLMKENDQESYLLAKALVSEFSRIACIEFKDVEELEQTLFAHLKTSLYRYRYGIQLGNPMLDDIKSGYPELFEITKKACEYLEQLIGVPIPDGEVAYLTLHFGGYMSAERSKKGKLDVLIICPNGMSTGNMLRGEIRILLPHADKIDVVPLHQYEMHKYYDVIISTISIEHANNLIVVHPILTDNDRVMILRKCMKYDEQYNIKIKAVIDIAKKYLAEHQLSEFQNEVMHCFTSQKQQYMPQKQHYGEGILYYLGEKQIAICDEIMEWRQSIEFLSEPLLINGNIEKSYIKAIIKHNEELGLYMFINEHVVLGHAKVEEGAKKIGLTMGIFHKPVVFDKGKEARIIMILSVENQMSHLRILNDIMTIFSKQSHVEQILKNSTKQEVLTTINNIINDECKEV